MKTFTYQTENGDNVAIKYLTDTMARIQIFPKNQEYSDSYMNKYNFITEPDKASDICTSNENGCTAWTSPQMSISRNAAGLLSLKDKQGNELFNVASVSFSPKIASIAFSAADDEDWVGFSDLTRNRLYHRGHKATCWVSDVASYLPVPFFMSTRGYSILINTTHCVIVDLCETKADTLSWKDERAVLDFYVMYSPTFKDGIRQYTELTGRPKLPPEWSFGLWYICRTQANDAEVMNDAVNFRREGIPCDLIGLEPGWMDVDYDLSLNKSWSKERFPLPDWQKKGVHTFIKALKRMGYHLELWLCNEYDLTYEEERKIKNQLRDNNSKNIGHAFDELNEMDEHFSQPRYMDNLTKKDEAWFDHLKKFVDWGADFFKQDGAFQVCTHPDRLYGNGKTDLEMHNLYPMMYARQMWEGFAQHTNRRPVVFTVSGWAGFQSWCGTWTGDTGGRLETLGAMLNTAMMGHCWATNDMEVMQPEGIHFGYLQPWSQINSWTYFRMPWLQGEKLLNMHKYYAKLRSSLIPYIYSSARESTLTSVPLMRPLTLEYQNDKECRNILNEYLLGRDLLIAIYKHELYLPEGEWKDYWTGKVYQGNQHLTYEWPEDRGGAVFIRQGAIIPFGPVMQYRHEKPLDEIKLYLFPSQEQTSFGLYEDDGVSFEYLNGNFALSEITMKQEGDAITIKLKEDAKSEVKRWILTIALPKAPQQIINNKEKITEFQWNESRQELTFQAIPGDITIIN